MRRIWLLAIGVTALLFSRSTGFAQPLPVAPSESFDAPVVASFQPPVRLAPPRNIPTLPETVVEVEPQLPPAARPSVARSDPLFGLFESPNDIGRGESLLGETSSASQGRIGQNQLRTRPLLRTGEMFETIPGVIVTQHSGSGKANQWFLRGFNLDHGTDFTIKLDGVPMNLPSHAHGQGYLDVNMMIPELVESINYKKGPYYADFGDFSSAGGAEVQIVNRLPEGIVKGGIGRYGYYRTLIAKSRDLGQGHLLFAFENEEYNGPWVVPEDFNKYNLLTKYTLGDDEAGITFSGQAYYAGWTATDQIAQRAIDQGIISRYGSLNPTDGGTTARFITNAQGWREWDQNNTTRYNVFGAYYRLDLFSDFTYFLNDPVNGDQIAQRDRRYVYGGNIAHDIDHDLLGRKSLTTLGSQLWFNDAPVVEIDHTVQRQVLSVDRRDAVRQGDSAVYINNTTWWRDDVRTIIGQRGDLFNFNVADSTPSTPGANSGFVAAGIWSPKASIVFGPWDKTEYFLNWGYGFHSNDARGMVTTIDPTNGMPSSPVTPLVRSQGYEAGFRSSAIPGLNTSLAVWYLWLDSELLFEGDTGTTTPSAPSQRFGVEWANYYQINKYVTYDFDFSATKARFVNDPDGEFIPNAIGIVMNTGPTFRSERGFYNSWRLRFFGPRPLIEDGSVWCPSTMIINTQFGYRTQRFQCGLDLYNVLGTTANDIAYYYVSRLPGEPLAGVADVHLHPVEAMGVRGFVGVGW
jgi:hypothetical protein